MTIMTECLRTYISNLTFSWFIIKQIKSFDPGTIYIFNIDEITKEQSQEEKTNHFPDTFHCSRSLSSNSFRWERESIECTVVRTRRKRMWLSPTGGLYGHWEYCTWSIRAVYLFIHSFLFIKIKRFLQMSPVHEIIWKIMINDSCNLWLCPLIYLTG